MGWQMWDFFRERGWSVVLVGVLIGFQVVHIVTMTGGVGDAFFARRAVNGMASPLVPLFVLLAINRIVSADRTAGYARLLFAKPISVSLYYAQRFVVHLAGLLICVLLLCVLLLLKGVLVSVASVLTYTIVVYVAMGGIGFLLSVLTRFDWTLLLAVWYGSEMVHTVYGRSGSMGASLIQALPPTWHMDTIRTAILDGNMPPNDILLWLVGYGAACFVAGVLLLERRSLSS
jgi:ABC-type transport system involved in multi-copper enzyme maturation permease subunit